MNGKDAFIHMFRALDNHYIYDVNTNTVIKVKEDIFEYLKSDKEGNEYDDSIIRRIDSMIKNGFLSNKRISEIEHPYSELLPFYLKNRMNVITLQVTQQCNLRCDYCAYSGSYDHRIHSEKSMSFETAQKGIDYVISNSSEATLLNIGFYGGEPLLRFDFIKECVEYAKEKSEGKQLGFHMTTNGTIMNEKVMDFLKENNFSLMISLDGPEEIHDKNRVFANSGKGSFRTIMNNISNFKKRYPEYVSARVRFNAVLDSSGDFKCTKNFFSTYEEVKDFKVNISSIADNYSKKYRIVNEEFVTQINYERFKALLSKLGKLDEKYTSRLFANEFLRLKDTLYKRDFHNKISEKEHPGGPCIPGIRKLFLSVDGTYYPCERVSELSDVMKIGNIHEGLNIEKINNILNIGKVSEEECKNCWSYRFCYVCASHADDVNAFSKEKKISNCPRVRFNAEENLKDFCALTELGCNFEENEINYYLA